MPRVNWTCLNCRKTVMIRDTQDVVSCPACGVESPRIAPRYKPERRKKSGWTASSISFTVIASIFAMMGVGYGGYVLTKALPKADPDRALAEQWLKENLQDGKWEQVKWYPPVTPQGLFDINLFRVVENTEKAKALYESGRGEDCREACKK